MLFPWRSRSALLLLLVLSLSFLPQAFASAIIEVPGQQLPDFLGKNVANIRLYSANSKGQLRPIPFQIDERVLDPRQGLQAWALGNLPGDGKLDAAEVLLFLESDAGSPVVASAQPGGKPLAELRLDAVGSQVVYLVYEEAPKPLAVESYIRYDEASDTIDAQAYQAGFDPKDPLVQNRLVIKRDSQGQNILDRFKLRLKLAIKNFFDFNIDEGQISAQRVGAKVGPIRVIRRLAASKKLGPIGIIPKSYVDFVFYPDWFTVPSRIQNPVEGSKFLEDKTTGISGYDFSKAIYGSQLYSNALNAPVILDGVSSVQESTVYPTTLKWWAFKGPQGAMVVGVKNDPKLIQAGVEPRLHVLDDAKTPSSPERESGQTLVGLDLPYHRMPKGDFLLWVKAVFPSAFDPARAELIVGETRTRPVREVRALP